MAQTIRLDEDDNFFRGRSIAAAAAALVVSFFDF
jgi:hypothetical protein